MNEKIEEELPLFHRTLLDVKEQADLIEKEIALKLKQLKTKDISSGVSLLDVKNLTMIQYMCDLIGVAKCKLTGASISGDKVGFVNRSVESRTVLEKIVPLEKKITYQIDKLVQDTPSAASDPLNFAPDVDDLVPSDQDSEGDDDGDINDLKSQEQKYVPPHIATIQYNEKQEGKEIRKAKELQRTIERSSVLADSFADISDHPAEISNYTATDRRNVIKQRNERLKFEEDNFKRVMQTKKEKNKELQTMRKSGLDSITHFAPSDLLYSSKNSSSQGGKKRNKTSSNGGGGNKRRRR